MQDDRFFTEIDDTGDWSVIDAETERPAVVGDKSLVGLPRAQAEDAADLLATVNRLRSSEPKPALENGSVINPFLLPVR